MMTKLIKYTEQPGKIVTTTKLKAPGLWRDEGAGMLSDTVKDAEYVEVVEQAPIERTVHLRVSFEGLNDALVICILPAIVALSLLIGYAALNTRTQPTYLFPANTVEGISNE